MIAGCSALSPQPAIGLMEIAHRGVFIATHAQRRPKGAQPSALRQPPPRRARRPNAKTVTRKVNSTGSVSFAGTSAASATRTRASPLR